MKIQSNLTHNITIMSRKQANVVIPAGSVLELSDELYTEIEGRVESLVEANLLEVIVKPKKTKEALNKEHQKAIAAARALLAAEDKLTKSK